LIEIFPADFDFYFQSSFDFKILNAIMIAFEKVIRIDRNLI